MISANANNYAVSRHKNGGEGVYISPIPLGSNLYQFPPQNRIKSGLGCLSLFHHLASKPILSVVTGVGMKLTAVQVKKIKEQGRYADDEGLYLYVSKSGNKSWVYRYQLNKRRRDMGLGKYPLISLAEARVLRDKASKLVKNGIDPIQKRNAESAANQAKKTFSELAAEFIEMRKSDWRNEKHAQQWASTLDAYAYPYIGDLTVENITTAKIRAMLEPIWLSKAETATRVRSRVENVIDYAIALDESDKANPASLKVISKVLPNNAKSKRVKHFKAMHYSDVPAFYAELSERNEVSANCLKLTILTACRTTESRAALRSEFKGDLWTIPAGRTKSGRVHRIPLCDYVQELIKSFPTVNQYLFAGARIKPTPLSNMAMLNLIKKTFNLNVTVHGFRSSFRDWVAECTNYDSRLAEAALAHVLQDKTEAAYQRGDLLEKRAELMAAWCDYVIGEIGGINNGIFCEVD